MNAARGIFNAVLISLALWGLIISAALAQMPPSGQAVLNQAVAARLLTKSDTTKVLVTRGIFIGDATACNVAIVMNQDTAAVTFTNVQSGAVYPYQIIMLMSTNTTCATVIALY